MPVTLFLASQSDREFASPILATLKEFDVEVDTIIASAHKVPEKVLEHMKHLNTSREPLVIITCVGKSNGLSGLVAGSTLYPVIACPVFKDKHDYLINIHSTIQMPSEIPVLTVLDPVNAALAAIRMLALHDKELRRKLWKRMRKVKEAY